MVLRFLPFLLALALPGAVAAQPVTPDALRAHIEILASDAFEGRAPGTEGEKKTIAYIADRLGSYGLEPGAADGSWFQPVSLRMRMPVSQTALFKPRRRAPVAFDQDELLLIGRDAAERVAGRRVLFVGYEMPDEAKGDERHDVEGAVVLLLHGAPEGAAPFGERAKALVKAGAAAVIGILDPDVPWAAVQGSYNAGETRLSTHALAPIQGMLSSAGAERLFLAAAKSFERVREQASAPGFEPVRLRLDATLEVRTQVRGIESNNVVGRLRGSGSAGQALLYLGHWDHLGICRDEGAADRICNGAVDNASGIAVMLEVARHLAAGPRPARDVLFLATTAEEMGLLGAYHFAAEPPVPLGSIVAAINLDTVAIAPAGEKVAILGGGFAPLDAAIAETVRQVGRELDTDSEAASFVTRQDGWALARAGVPAVMVGGSFSDMAKLREFLGGPYHAAEDDLSRPLVLGGAAEDADLLIALGRRLADPAAYAPAGPAGAAVKPFL